MAHGFDIRASVKSTIDKVLRIDLPLILCTDSKSLYKCLVKLGTTQEKRLIIDVMCLRQAYKRREIAQVKWIEGTTNPADSMTKSKPSNALKLLLDTNKVQMKVQEWVERE
jgi:tryptophanyl-tRNA synthetase